MVEAFALEANTILHAPDSRSNWASEGGEECNIDIENGTDKQISVEWMSYEG